MVRVALLLLVGWISVSHALGRGDDVISFLLHEMSEPELQQEQHRDTQAVSDCRALLSHYKYFPGCRCEQPSGGRALRIVCDDFCEICLEQADFCAVTSTVAEYADAAAQLPARVEVIQRQTGSASSEMTFKVEQRKVGATKFCTTYLDGQKCNSCQQTTDGNECPEGAIHDCTNLGVPAIVNTCDEAQMTSLPLSSPFVTQGSDDFSYAKCAANVLTSSPTKSPGSAGNTLPSKKTLPSGADERTKSKLFNEDAERGGLGRTRQLRGE